MKRLKCRTVMPLVNFSGSSMEARYGGLPYGKPMKSYDASGPIRPWVMLKDVIEVIENTY